MCFHGMMFRLLMSCVSVVGAFATGSTGIQPRPLTEWRFQAGDSPAWASQDFDDSQWRTVRPPVVEHLPWFCPRGWFRCTFSLPDSDLDADWGLWLGRIENADEVYLNGCRIGGRGIIGDAFVDAPRALRLYRLPNELLGETNTVAVRVQNSYPSGGLAGRPELGPFADLLIRQHTLESRQMVLDAFLIGVMTALALFWGMLRRHGLRQSEFRYAGWFALLLGSVFIFESLLFDAAGLMSPALCRVYIATCLILPIPVLDLVRHLAESVWLRRYARAARIAVFSLAGLYLVLGNLTVCPTFHAVWCLLLLTTFILFAITWLNPAARRVGDVSALGIGLVLLGAGALADFVMGLVGSSWSRTPLHLAYAVFAGAVLLDLSSRFARLQRTLHALSQRLLTSREDEARRISRDLHDGLGQALAAAKLSLQCIRQRQPPVDRGLGETIDALVQETSRNIELLHRTVHRLRPAALSELGFAAALRELGSLGDDPEAPAFRFDIDDSIRCTEELEDNLYRIAQEAVGNALKHAGCRTIWVRGSQRDGQVCLQIEDDGIGFDLRSLDRSGGGLGLVAMRERLAPFGGKLTVRTEVGGGTTITAEVRNP